MADQLVNDAIPFECATARHEQRAVTQLCGERPQFGATPPSKHDLSGSKEGVIEHGGQDSFGPDG